MSNDTVQATSQPVEAPPAPETKSDAPNSNLSVAQAAQRLLNMQAENAQAQAKLAEQVAQPDKAEEPASTEAAPAESVESEAPEPEAQATEPEAEEDSVPSQISPEIQKNINKRIGKEVAKRKAVEAQLNELKLEMARQSQQQQQAQPAPVPIAPLPQGTVPLAQIEDYNGLQSLAQQAKEAKRFAQQQLAKTNFEPIQLGEQVLDREALNTIIINAEKTLEDDIPARTQFLQQRGQAQQLAYEKFPFLKDKSTPEYVAAQQAYLQMPWLKNLPNAEWIIGVQIEGLKALQAKEKGKAKPAKAGVIPSSKPPSSQTVATSGSSESRVPASTKSATQVEALRQHLSKKGGVTTNEAVQFLLAREAAKQTR
jgi:hypothetical protein